MFSIKDGQLRDLFAVVKMWSNKFVFCAFVVIWAKAEQDVQLEIPQGFLKGLKINSVMQNRPFYSFRGIPYAKPNIGLNKFQVS